MKKYIICLAICALSFVSFAQSQDAKAAYRSFLIYRTEADGKPKQIAQTLALLKLSDQLSPKQLTNINYHLGRMYEDVEDPDNALIYYEKSLAGEPNYEVVNRALGFIYLSKSAIAAKQANAASEAKDAANAKAFAVYKEWVLKALPRLEKYQACSPDDDTLGIIINLYRSLKDTNAINTLNARLKEMSAKCVGLLDDE